MERKSQVFGNILSFALAIKPVHKKEQIARDSDRIRNARNTRADSQARAFRRIVTRRDQ